MGFSDHLGLQGSQAYARGYDANLDLCPYLELGLGIGDLDTAGGDVPHLTVSEGAWAERKSRRSQTQGQRALGESEDRTGVDLDSNLGSVVLVRSVVWLFDW